MIIEVKRKHIHDGVPVCGTHCPVALALKEAGLTCQVDTELIRQFMTSGPTAFIPRWKPSRPMKRFIRDFDNGRPVKPTRFSVRPIK